MFVYFDIGYIIANAPLIVDALIRAMRVIAGITGILVFIDCIGFFVRREERPPHNPARNALGWGIVGLGTAVFSMLLLDSDVGLVSVKDGIGFQLCVLGLYACWALGFTIRAISTSERPKLIVSSVLGMSVFGIFFTFIQI